MSISNAAALHVSPARQTIDISTAATPPTRLRSGPRRAKLSIIIDGGGVAGPVAAFLLAREGHAVTLFERRPAPDVAVGVPDERGGFFTINRIGRDALGREMFERLVPHGVAKVGRQIHDLEGSFKHLYGLNPNTDSYLSVGREVFRAQITGEAIACGANVRYECEVTDITAEGRVRVRTCDGDSVYRADLVVGCDGTRGLSRPWMTGVPGVSHHTNLEEQYITGSISGVNAARAGLDVHFMQFFPSGNGPGVALARPDGGFSVLLIGPLPGDFLSEPFAGASQAEEFLARWHPKLLRIEPGLPRELARRRRGGFYYSSTDKWAYGKVVVAGDAGRSSPAYLGTGACLAMNDAATLAKLLAAHTGDVGGALREYEVSRRQVALVVQRLIHDHGRMLLTELGTPMWRLARRCQEQLERWLGVRSRFQTVAFQPGGLDIAVQDELRRRELVQAMGMARLIQNARGCGAY